MTTADILRKARALIEDPAHWRQNGFGVDGESYCAVGACAYALRGRIRDGSDECIYGDNTLRPVLRALDHAAGKVPNRYGSTATIEYLNDDVGHEAVLAAFDIAVAAASAEERS